MRGHSLAITSLKTVKRFSIINNVIQSENKTWKLHGVFILSNHALGMHYHLSKVCIKWYMIFRLAIIFIIT